MLWLIFSADSVADAVVEFDAVNATMNTAFGYPSADGKTKTYAAPIPNPDPHVYEVAMCIEDRCLPWLTDAQKTALVTTNYLQLAGWFSTGAIHG